MSAISAGTSTPVSSRGLFVKPTQPATPKAGSLAGLVANVPNLDRFSVELGAAAQEMLVNVLKVTREQLAARGFARVMRADQVHAWVEKQGVHMEVSCLVADRDNEVAFTVLVLLHVCPDRAATLLPVTRIAVSLNIGRAGLMPLDNPEDAKAISSCVLVGTFLPEEAIVDADPWRYLQSVFARLGAGQAEDALQMECAATVAALVRELEP